MVARSQMGGPWSRAQRVARAFQDGGHEVTLAWGDDGNCANPIAPTLEIPVPSPLGLPEAIARHTFPLASRLGLMGRKPVHSFEEVLWLTGALDERYTRAAVDTLRALRRQYPNGELLLFMGTDMFFSFESWRAPEEIAELAKVVAFYRNADDSAAAFAAQAEKLRARFGGSFEALALDRVIEVSSTALRAGMASGTSEAMLEPQVYGYILREHLYGTNLDLKRLTVQQLRPIALSYLKAKRCAHVLGTAATAVKLAEKYGVDVHRAEVAGLLHDCTKKLSMPEQLALCEKYGIALDELEKKALKLLHAKTGAALARDVFGVDDEIYNAILWHTTGKPDMTVLEKVIYLADFIEPTRDFPGVDALRRTVWEDLDRGLLMGLEMTVEEMEEMGNPIHVNTLAARDYLKGKTNEGKAGSGQQL